MSVATLSHVELLCPDLEASVEHFYEMLGMEISERTENQVWMRGWGDWEHFTLTLTGSDRTGIGHISFQVEEPEDLAAYAERIEATGYEVEWLEPGAEPGQGEAIRFTYPGGHQLELVHEMAWAEIPADRKTRLKNQPQKIPTRGIGVRRIDHVNVFVPNVLECRHWFEDVLDFKLRERIVDEDGNETVSFMSVTPLVHEIAFGEGRESATNHVAFYLKTRGELFRAADLLMDHEVQLTAGPGQHGASQAYYLYHLEPSGNQVELFAGGYLIFNPNWEPITWTPDDFPEALYWWGGKREWSPQASPMYEGQDYEVGEDA